jgi:hypothetical protein
MTIDKNDPRLTAYALGELDAAESAAFAAALANEPAAQAEVNDIRRAADDLRLALADESTPALTEQQRETIRGSAARGPTDGYLGRLRLLYWTLAAAAACVAISTFISPRTGRGARPLSLAQHLSPASQTAPASAAEPESRTTDEAKAKRVLAAAERGGAPAAMEAPLAMAPAPAAAAPAPEPALFALAAAPESESANADRLPEPLIQPAPGAAPAAAGLQAVARGDADAPASRVGLLALGVAVADTADAGVAGAPSPDAALREDTAVPDQGLPDPLADAVAANAGLRVAPAKLEMNAQNDAYKTFPDSPFRSASETPMAMVPLSVDSTVYDAVRSSLQQGRLPPPDAIRIGDLVNHYRYGDATTRTGFPFSVRAEVTTCPWKPEQRLVRVAVTRSRQQTVATLDGVATKAAARPAAAGAVGATAAADVRLQVEFAPARVAVYRRLGDDVGTVVEQLGEQTLGGTSPLRPGQCVNAFYQVVPTAAAPPTVALETAARAESRPLVASAKTRARPAGAPTTAVNLLTVTLRWPPVDARDAGVLTVPVPDQPQAWEQTSSDLQFGSAVALFGLLLRQSPHAAGATFDTVLALAAPAAGGDAAAERAEFLELVRLAKRAQSAVPPR